MMTRRRLLYAAGVGAAAAAAAPTLWVFLGRSPESDGHPAIALGRDRCDACGMIISDLTYAAAARERPAVYRYDDIGCLIRHAGRALAARRASAYVWDAAAHAWIDASSATFVRSPTIRSPMGYGLAAYGTSEAARRAHPGASLLTFEALLTQALQEGS